MGKGPTIRGREIGNPENEACLYIGFLRFRVYRAFTAYAPFHVKTWRHVLQGAVRLKTFSSRVAKAKAEKLRVFLVFYS